MAKKHRSPSYPALSLSDAVDRAMVLYQKEGRNKVAIHAAVQGWGYSQKSSGGMASVAALKTWGLLEDEGTGASRRVWLSPHGLDIVRDNRPNSSERAKRLAEMALAPKIIATLHEQFGSDPVSDENLRYFLESAEYNPNAVKDIIKVYRDALSYVEDDAGPLEGRTDEEEIEKPEVSVGDMVQWTSQGTLQFQEAKRVRALEFHHGDQWAFVDGSETGIPVAELTIESKSTQSGKNPAPFLAEEPKTSQERLEGRLSKTTTYQLLVSGDLGPKEIGKLIRVLEAQKEVLSDDEED